ncbi:hypothetical protein EV643_115198 [Kribbella sp. VKM Ac-2527]|uniref:Uncharacterized protein n=1 Tax=Kribbella caucasensis TaxID=2512215 RepID=A0A4R6K5M0_9ACTN|nr:hypothetical protein [Kribbella sp. VKM Ac-2527]TDO44696.1 hypothetical protein EV643_115198 [Kribbella sp. VKM Ac-2527]
MFRRALVLVVAVVAIGLGLTGCAGDNLQPAPEQAGSGQAGSGQQAGSGSPVDELDGIRSTLDTIDSELAGDG